MKLSICQIKYTATTSAMMDVALKGQEYEPLTDRYRMFTLRDVSLEVLADGLVRLQGTIKLYWKWWPFLDDPAPQGWPKTTFTRHPWNPMQFLYGPTYERAIPGSLEQGTATVDIVVPSSLVTGIPA
jgi:hypothetical protein